MKKAYSWQVIIISLIFFFPVGLYLLYKRYTWDKAATVKNQKGLSVTGWILICVAILYFIRGLSGEIKNEDGSSAYDDVIMMVLIFGLIGAIFLKTASKIKRIDEKTEKYLMAIIKQKQYIIENIAAFVGVSYKQAIRDLKRMINAGYFSGSYIDEEQHEFIFPKNDPINAQRYSTATQNKIVKCQNCGANNTAFIEQVSECEYCGSPIEMTK